MNSETAKVLNFIKSTSIGSHALFGYIYEHGSPPTTDNYPPYNIYRKYNHEYLLIIAATGFNKDELSVQRIGSRLVIQALHLYGEPVVFKEIRDGALDMSCQKTYDDSDAYEPVHRALANRDFVLSFEIFGKVENISAFLLDGTLRIKVYLEKETTDCHKIAIGTPKTTDLNTDIKYREPDHPSNDQVESVLKEERQPGGADVLQPGWYKSPA